MTRQAPVNYRGFSIEQERDFTFSIFNFGYVAGGFKTEVEARANVDWRKGA